jgi:ubiquinone/menaquinone biosynthesis C-methylase UbiE
MINFTYHDFLAHFGIGGAHPGGLALTIDLLKGERINSNSKVLDAGCGTGQTSAYLSRTYGCHVTALDKHPMMLQKAAQRFRKEKLDVELVRGDVENIPLAPELFDLVLVESVTVFTNISKSLKEYARVLKPKGILLDLEMTAVAPFSSQDIQQFQRLYGISQVPTEKEWKNKFQEAGLQSVEIVKEKMVASALQDLSTRTNFSPSTVELPEFNPSDPIDPNLYDIWDEHQSLTERYSDKLKYNVYRIKR